MGGGGLGAVAAIALDEVECEVDEHRVEQALELLPVPLRGRGPVTTECFHLLTAARPTHIAYRRRVSTVERRECSDERRMIREKREWCRPL